MPEKKKKHLTEPVLESGRHNTKSILLKSYSRKNTRVT